MRNEIVVTRASRIRTCTSMKLKDGGFYLQCTSKPDNRYAIFCREGILARTIHGSFVLSYDIELGDHDIVPFESFEAMCKWVAGGRKLEDLAGAGKDEWIPASQLPVGSFGEVMEMWGNRNPGDVVQNTGIGDYMLYDLGSMQSNSAANKNGDMIVWPLKDGDSITITPKNP